MAKHQFQTEVNQLLHLMIHSLYSNKEIFLRELVSNSSDALDKLQYLTLTDESYKGVNFTPRIDLKFDKDSKTLTISDNGIGMNSEDLIESLGTIAKSGTKSFLERLSGDAKKDSNLIGQFGVGFYSAFMVASKIEVTTKKANESKAYKWISEGTGEYEIEETQKDEFGTEVKLYLRDDEDEFLAKYRIKSVIEKYSNHIPFPIYLTDVEEKEEDGKKVSEIVTSQINKASALWRVSKSEIKDEEYSEFYKSISHDSQEPLVSIHTKLEGNLEYTTLFYVPKKAPFDLYKVYYQSGIKLYIKRVFITDDDKELMPTYLRFLRGIIDSEDLPLNVSREILQHNPILNKIKTQSVKKVLSELKKVAMNDKDKYREFWSEFGRVLKEGLYSDFENKESILELARFKSINSDSLISLDEYKESMKADQSEIYYLVGEDERILKNSPLLESFKEKGIDVLILDDEVDNIVMPMINEYKSTPIKPASEANITEDKTVDTEQYKEILEKIRESLKDDVKDAKISTRLSKAPACIVFDSQDPNYTLQKMLKQMGQMGNLPEVKPILEINPKSEIFEKLINTNDKELFDDILKLLLDEAKLLEGIKLDNILDFTARLNKVISKAI